VEDVASVMNHRSLSAGEGTDDAKLKELVRKKGLPLLFKGIAAYEKEMAAGRE
jgi:hypothetical protein